MTTTYDPHHAQYFDEKDVRDELTRAFGVCHGCQRCVTRCGSFPTLVAYVDAQEGHDAGRLTPAQQDHVVDQCFQCKLCAIGCPFTADRHEFALDFPRLMLRARAMRHTTGQVSARSKATSEFMNRVDLLGTVGSAAAPIVNRAVGATPGTFVRKALEKTTGVSSKRVLAPYARQRFSTWFKKRARLRLEQRQGRVAVYPTCLVEYHVPEVGHDLVKVYERNGVECSLADAGCCGAPWLHVGDVAQFRKAATKVVKVLAAAVRQGNDIVVPQPTCGYVLKHEFVDHVGGPDAQLVASHTYDAAEYLMNLHRGERTALNTDFHGEVPPSVTYHAPCHLRAQDIGLRSRDLLRLTGTKVRVVQQCSGTDAMWGLRAENADLSLPVARSLADAVGGAGGAVVAGDCHLANAAILEQTGSMPLHPLQVVARAYGISPESR